MKKTAILYFTRGIDYEVDYKQLSTSMSKQRSKALLKFLDKNSKSSINKSGMPVFEIGDTQQVGENFGERLSNAIDDIFQKGFDSLITIGNDCPDLKTSDLQKAEELLETQNFVLGPDLRGGLYLIGIQKKAFQKSDFQKLDWQTDNLKSSFLNFANSLNFRTVFLDRKIDINYHKDLVDFVNQCSNQIITTKIISLLQFPAMAFIKIVDGIKIFGFSLHLVLRGPPSVI